LRYGCQKISEGSTLIIGAQLEAAEQVEILLSQEQG